MSTAAYHLWLAPSGATHAALATVIRNLAQEFDAPVFEPHVTLLANLSGREPELLQRADALARQLQPTRIVLTEPSFTDEFFQCLFMQVERTPDLMRLRTLAAAAFERDPHPYQPHLSLLYGSFASALKRAAIGRLPPEARTCFVAETLHLIRADSMAPQDWHHTARFAFTREQGGKV